MLARLPPVIGKTHARAVLVVLDLEAVGRHQDIVIGEVRIRHDRLLYALSSLGRALAPASQEV